MARAFSREGVREPLSHSDHEECLTPTDPPAAARVVLGARDSRHARSFLEASEVFIARLL